MSTVDIIIVAGVMLSALIGVFRGFVREVLSVLSWILAIVVAFMFYGTVANDYLSVIEDSLIRRVVAFAVLFVVTLVVSVIISQLIHRLVSAAGLKPVDRVLGFSFGLLRGGAIVAAVAVLAADTSLSQADWWRQSQLASYFEQAGRVMVGWVPSDIAQQIGYR